MHSYQEDLEKKTTDYKINIQIITFVIVMIILISTLVNFIQIYSNKKNEILSDMEIEARLLKTVIAGTLNYSKYFIKLISRSIKRNPDNLAYIKDTMQNHFQSREFNLLFGWRKYSWVDNNFHELVTSTAGIEKKPRTIEFVRDIVQKEKSQQNIRDTIVFRINKTSIKAHSLKLVNSVFDDKTDRFIGAVILSYDIDTMIKSLNAHKRSDSNINFVIVDDHLNIVAKSKPGIDKIINENDELSSSVLKALQQFMNHSNDPNNNDFPYLDMINGVNYYIQSLDGLPFTVIVNIDNKFIKTNIVDSITTKVIEASFFAFLCLIVIISIYKRESSLRSKSEKALVLANNATKAKTNFLAFTAHEIRSPLGFILTGSEIMSKELLGPIPEAYSKYANGIYKNAQNILDFIIDILDEDQIIEGKFKIVNSLNDIDEIVNDVIKRYIGKKGISIITDLEDNLPLLICDRRRIIQVMDNLIGNSIKYSDNNANIIISAKVKDSKIIISVADKGIGMKEEDIPIALSKYGTLDKQDYKKGGSYGLGLPIVKMLLDAHEAEFELHSILGQGTTATITFPKSKIVDYRVREKI